MDTTASYSAACRMAKLRVGCTVAGCAPGVPRMVISSLFQSTTDCPEPGDKATDAGGPAKFRPVAAVAGAATPATTAAAARKIAAFRVLRMLRCPLRVGISWRCYRERPRATAAQGHLLTRVVLERCSTSPVKLPT